MYLKLIGHQKAFNVGIKPKNSIQNSIPIVGRRVNHVGCFKVKKISLHYVSLKRLEFYHEKIC